jgi:hypothetical protein
MKQNQITIHTTSGNIKANVCEAQREALKPCRLIPPPLSQFSSQTYSQASNPLLYFFHFNRLTFCPHCMHTHHLPPSFLYPFTPQSQLFKGPSNWLLAKPAANRNHHDGEARWAGKE